MVSRLSARAGSLCRRKGESTGGGSTVISRGRIGGPAVYTRARSSKGEFWAGMQHVQACYRFWGVDKPLISAALSALDSLIPCRSA